MGLADYLAQNYLSADKSSKSKKRKRKHGEDAGLVIADDDVSGLSKSRNREDDDDFIPVMVPGGANISNRTTTWKTFGQAAPTNTEQAAADAILADAAAETNARNAEDEDAPAMIGGGDEDMDYDGPQMASGAMAGLQTAEQVAKALKRREREEKKAMQEMGMDPSGKPSETIYRDASGRIINVAMKRAELRRKADEEERKKADEAESRRGDVQRREKEARMRELEKAKSMSLSRYADDRQLNDEQKELERWNDPALRFLSKDGTKGSKGTKGIRKKTYTGAFEPNRYGIRPGFRWDGVDRSIGFEKRWFEARNQQQNIKDLKYAWQMDE